MATNRTQQIVQDWRRGARGVAAYIRAMPEEHLDYRPVPAARTFAEQFLHVAETNVSFAAVALSQPHLTSDSVRREVTDSNGPIGKRDQLLSVVLTSVDLIIEGVERWEGPEADELVRFGKLQLSRSRILEKAFEHQCHHRGQATVYFRLVGITPPLEGLF
jgi:uncharacterized damage-inducible protein DinB